MPGARSEYAVSIFAVNKNLEIVWMQRGRNGSYYGDKALQDYLDCDFEIVSLHKGLEDG